MAKKKTTADFTEQDWDKFIRSVHRGREFIPDLMNDEQWRSFVFANEGPFKAAPPVTIAQADFFSKASEHFKAVLKEATGVTVTQTERANGTIQTIARDAGGRFTSFRGALDTYFGR